MIFSGVCTAIVTPFDQNKKVDYKSFYKLITKQIEAKVSAIVVLGTTGESSTIDFYEREQIILFAKKLLPKNIKLIVGTGSNNTKTAIKYSKQAKELEVDGILCVTPYYNKCTQNGIFEYYKQINNVGLPFIAYNVPSRTGVNILPKTYQKLCLLKNFAGIKEANGNIDHILQTFAKVKNVPIYCGNDNVSILFHLLGGKGVISVTSNAFAKEVVCAWKSLKEHKQYFDKFFDINCDLFIEPNPIPIKYVLAKQKLIKNVLREPLTKIQNEHKKIIDKDLMDLWK